MKFPWAGYDVLMKYWLMKSEASAYSIDDLKRDKRTAWEGVRNYQARNFMREMERGDLVLYYHSGEDAGVYGIAKVSAKAHPDHSQFDAKDTHYDPKASPKRPIWECVDVAFVEKLKRPVPLAAIKAEPALRGIMVAKAGVRLSVQPVSKAHFECIRGLGN